MTEKAIMFPNEALFPDIPNFPFYLLPKNPSSRYCMVRKQAVNHMNLNT